MLDWSINFLLHVIKIPVFGSAALVVAAFNMLMQICFDFIFVRRDWGKLGGWFK